MIEIGGNQRARGLINLVDGVEHSNQLQQLLSNYQRHMRPRIVLMKHDAFPIRYFWTFLFNCCLQFV